MCNTNKVATLLTLATVAIAAALVLAIVAIALAGSFWTAASNVVGFAIASGLVGVAIINVSLASIEAAKCTRAPCKTEGDRLLAALYALNTTLGALLVATIAAIICASIAYFGVGVAIAVAAATTAVGIALIVVSANLLPALDTCNAMAGLARPSRAVGIQSTVGLLVGAVVIMFGLVGLVAFAPG